MILETGILVMVFGLMIGSFLNVCIHRIPREESIISPGSHCPKCDHKLAAWENIPLFSFIFLKARCRKCSQSISFRYPLVESITGLLFLLAFLNNGIGLNFFLSLIFITILILITFIDLDTFHIPDNLLVIGLLPGLITMYLNDWSLYLKGGIGLVLLFYLIRVFGRLVFKKEAMGFGDVKFVGIIGLFLGWKIGLVATFSAFFCAALFSISLLVTGKLAFGEKMPFGPFLSLGALMGLFWGSEILEFYWNYFT